MAATHPSLRLLLPLLLLLLAAPAISAATEQIGEEVGRLVGGRTKIKDVASNREVQDLGRFSVEEYNRQQRESHGGGYSVEPLTFAKVVKAESQVVSGIKYFLTVAAEDGRGARRTFEAVVVVKAWLKSRELLSFTPSPN